MRSSSRYSPSLTLRRSRDAYSSAPAKSCALDASSTPAIRTSSRSPWLRTAASRIVVRAPPRTQPSSAPGSKTMRPALVASHFNSPWTPKTPAILATTTSLESFGVIPEPLGRLAGVENVDGNSPFGRCAHDSTQRLRDASAAADHLAEVLGIDDQLDHRLLMLVDEQLDRDALRLLHELACQEPEQVRRAAMTRPWIVRRGARLSRAALGRARRARGRLFTRLWFFAARGLALYFVDDGLAEQAELVIERAHAPLPSACFAARFVVGIGPRSMMPFSANSRRTVSDGCAPLANHSRAFVSSTTTVRGSVRGL